MDFKVASKKIVWVISLIAISKHLIESILQLIFVFNDEGFIVKL